MTSPVRIQRRRIKGWRMPADAIYVGRPTKWGNLWKVSTIRAAILNSCFDLAGPRQDSPLCEVYVVRGGFLRAVLGDEDIAAFAAREMFARLVGYFRATDALGYAAWLAPLHGKDLACWCGLDRACHADVLLDLANNG